MLFRSDVLEVQGYGITGMTLQGRRELLEKVVEQGTYAAISPAFNDGQELLDTVVERGLEGVVAKLRASRYVEGSRTEAWTKVKVRNEQEFVVVGFTPGEGARASTFGALVLAVNDPTDEYKYRYVGKVGTWFDDSDLLTLMERLDEQAVTPVSVPSELTSDLRDIVWCKPDVVVQVAYQRWTEDNRLWHPSFKGIGRRRRLPCHGQAARSRRPCMA